MNKKIILCFIFISLFLIGGIFFVNNFLLTPLTMNKKDVEKKVYQGPIRPTDDEIYFRETGITKHLEINR